MRILMSMVLTLVVSMSVWSREMVLTCGDAYPPLCFVDNGSVAGIEIDVMKALAKRQGFSVKARALPWARAQEQVRTGEADAFITITTPERQDYAVMSPTVLFSTRLVAATAKNNPRLAELRTITTLQDTLGFPQVNYVGSSLVTRELAGAQISYLNSTDAIFQFLLLGRADLFLETDVVLSYNAARLHLLDQIEILPPAFEVTEFRLGVSKRSPFASDMPALSRAIEAMQNDGTIAAILNKYTR